MCYVFGTVAAHCFLGGSTLNHREEHMKTAIRRSIAGLLVVSVTGLGMPVPAQAGTVSTEETIATKRDRVTAMLDRAVVHAALEARGVSPADAQARVAALTDQEVAALATRIDAHPAGGGTAALGVLLMLAYFALAMAAGSAINSLGRGSKEPQRTPEDDAGPFPTQR
jgi:hypothetical protein